MGKSEKLQELMDKQLLGKLKPTEAAALAAAKQEDPSLEAELVASIQAVKAIEIYNDQQLKYRLQKLEQRLQKGGGGEFNGNTDSPSASVPRLATSRSRKWLALVASLLLLVAATWWWVQASASTTLGAETFAAHFSPHRNLAVNITRASEMTSPEERAYAAYEAANWSEAAKAIAALPPSPLHDFYRAQIALQEEEASQAVQLLSELVQTDFPLQQEAQWYLALAYMQQNQSEQAARWLQRILAVPDHPYQKEAKQLLQE